MNWLRKWWWARQRATDLAILWPICKELAEDLDHAKAAFMWHAANTPCWVRHYELDLWKVVNRLE